MSTLNRQAFGGLLFLVVVLGLALFIPAGTLDYWQAWLFLAVFFVSVLAITLYLMRHDPALLARRVQAGPVAETRRGQQVIQGLASLAFLGIFVVSGLDRRFGWSAVPVWAVLLGDVVVAVGLWMVFLVFKENSFTSAVIEIGESQSLVSTGPYAVVRHPMYAGAMLMLLGVPPALGSWWAWLMIVPMLVVIVLRLLDEEAFLVESLPGYGEYRERVRFRLLPGVW
jgi:protein-S-isoprenylcysteine O-methyltransferase Ste14